MYMLTRTCEKSFLRTEITRAITTSQLTIASPINEIAIHSAAHYYVYTA